MYTFYTVTVINTIISTYFINVFNPTDTLSRHPQHAGPLALD